MKKGLIKCRYCQTEFEHNGEGLQVCPGCQAKLIT